MSVYGGDVRKKQQREPRREPVMPALPPERESSVQADIIHALRMAFGDANSGALGGVWIGVNRAGQRGRGSVKSSHGKGATDLTVVLDGVVTFAEVKRDAKQKLSDAQVAKHAQMRAAGCFVVVWYEPGMAVRDVMERRGRR